VKEETGNKYNRLTVIKFSHKDKWQVVHWKCRCECGNEVVVSGGKLRSGHTKSCGCYKTEKFINERPGWNKGIPRSEKSLKKFKAKMRGRKRPPFSKKWKERIGRASKGRKMSLENKIKLSERCSGEKCHLWKGGITPINSKIRHSVQYIEWRNVVFERDNYTCQHCFARNGNGKSIHLEAHHIKQFAHYPKLRFNIDNGVTLCRDCHNKINHSRNNLQKHNTGILPNGQVV
jgi:5-methylcytosine-specific restriction endonuclease McrA